MLACAFCEFAEDGTPEELGLDVSADGYWCDWCDSFNYNDWSQRPKFTLILEDKHASLPQLSKLDKSFSKRLSPLRYPGGKSKLVDYLYSHLRAHKAKKLISPFTGGGSFELALLHAGAVDSLHINDLDTGIYSLWWTIKYMPYALIDRLEGSRPTHRAFFEAQNLIKQGYQGANAVEAAWAALLVNRLAYSGVAKANPLGGKRGSRQSLLSRWNPQDLIQRIEQIHALSDRIDVSQEQAVDLIEEAYWDVSATIFIDPPYVAKGQDLYPCAYQKQDHVSLAVVLDSLHSGFPGADFLVTYDNDVWLRGLYDHPQVQVIGRHYSI